MVIQISRKTRRPIHQLKGRFVNLHHVQPFFSITWKNCAAFLVSGRSKNGVPYHYLLVVLVRFIKIDQLATLTKS